MTASRSLGAYPSAFFTSRNWYSWEAPFGSPRSAVRCCGSNGSSSGTRKVKANPHSMRRHRAGLAITAAGRRSAS